MAGSKPGLEVRRGHGFLQVERRLPVGLLGLADGQRRPGAPLHELPLRRRVDALAGRALYVVVALGALQRQIAGQVAVHRVGVAVADDVVDGVPRHDAGRPVRAVAVQVVVGAPPAARALLAAAVGLALFALAALAVFVVALVVVVVVGVVVVVVVVGALPVRLALGAVDLGRTLQGVRLGEELLHRMDQVANAAGALVALLRGGGGGGGALVL